MTPISSLNIHGHNLSQVHNRNEYRVAVVIARLLAETPEYCTCTLCVEDMFALALNSLPAHYVQTGSIVLNPNPSEAVVEQQVRHAIHQVGKQPNHAPMGMAAAMV